MFEAAKRMVTTPATTLGGIEAVCSYLGPMFDEGSDSFQLPDTIEVDGEEVSPHGPFAKTIAKAAKGLAKSAIRRA